ncbi:PA2169 family four-helix-bundle protein [Maribacter sp. TH_r10]|uniref:PA2169 family four-helix-bundle protein n=1 Tax=Maribacter luteus TaxID=2594478 RepID=A0A6I2MT31_9FLAO|nr:MULTISPECIES: PA2169 family four-helix-bundle protein [Maribacter]MDV7139543.1 PA2169 family four-helix-bundle protein [Maribacter sp. TH_r10]MRX64486.1 PA2169 family four-helix-bundle protein [Maribacter luteus]
MSTYTETISEKLNDLLEKLNDAEKGYKKAAENTNHPLLKPYFQKRSKERHDFGLTLKSEIEQFGEDAENSGSITGAIHRAWMDTKAFFSTDDAEAMLEESIRGEKAAVSDYKEVLEDTSLPPTTAILLRKQLSQIIFDLNNIKTLEDLS